MARAAAGEKRGWRVVGEGTEWFMKPYWRRQRTIAAAVLHLTVEHSEEHIPSLQAWADRRGQRSG